MPIPFPPWDFYQRKRTSNPGRFDHCRTARAGMVMITTLLCGLCGSPPVRAAVEDPLASPSRLKKLSVEQLMDIEVTSVSRRPEKLAEAASAIQVITQEDIRRSGATSLPEALRLASNLEVAQIDSRQWAISARGFNSTTSNKLLVLIDGRTVYTPLYAGVFWDVQDTLLEDVDRIEVISGPGATLWGANAVNGVINITTKSARDTQGALLLAGGGNQLQDFGGLRYGGRVGSDFSYRVYGKYQARDGAKLPDGGDIPGDWHTAQGGFRVDGDISPRDALTIQGDFYDGRSAQPTPGDIAVSGANALARWSRGFSEKSDLKLQVYLDYTHRFMPGSFGEDLTTLDLDFQHRFALGDGNGIVWGLGYRQSSDSIDKSATLAFLPADIARRWYSAFAQDEIALIAERLNLTLGTKIEHNEYTGVEFEPSVRLAWRVSPRNTVWSAVSRAVRTPSRIDRELFAPGNPPYTLIAGSPNFDSEKLVAYEVGYRTQLREKWSLALSTYYNDYQDLRSVEHIAAPAPFPVSIGNGLTGESYGAELTLDYHVTDAWRLRAGYSELRIHLSHKPGSTDSNAGSNESHDSDHQLLLRSSLDLPGRWQFDATYRQVSAIANQNVPAYDELDIRLGWQPISSLEISLVGQNLLHDQHPEFGALTASPSSIRREIERSVYGKAVWRF
jgi:iron complex outermembrane receptor protein